ncbi:class I adenylate-forming enzyme family protein [Bosea sp. (in: a-proteobacteria)]|uniref:class I adenylate-forming enzyme family protein n=1 Tax=Bosea sp. (in: a-proteobacteria) TaxID=1871050 RepID=UPI00261A36EB|nr:class I adenylate-forming enzyme family protein [Bosea sp. (in: a-proteobacteria)]MCO5089599.1 acyl--CoA ligase [Bosea sp. (in: a-proteobacteria)]
MPTIDAVLSRAALAAPEQLAVREWSTGRSLTYDALDRAVSALAGWMAARGFGAGAAVAIHLPNSADFLIAQFASFRSSGVAAYVNFRLAASEAARQIGLSGARFVVTTAAKAQELRGLLEGTEVVFVLSDGAGPAGESLAGIVAAGGDVASPEGREDSDAIIRFTSGSTGAPKGVVVSHQAWLIRAVSILAEEIQVCPYSTTLLLGPLSHQAGLFVLPTFMRRGTLLILEKFDADDVARILATERVSCSQMVPTILGFVLENAASREALRLSGVRQLVYGGSPARASLVEETLALLPQTELMHVYGSHEAGSISHLDGAGHRNPQLRGSAGTPFLAAQVRVARPDRDGIGEIEVKAPWLPHARITEAGRETLTAEWAATGDLGEMKDGYIFLRDRMNDVIISGGFNVYPAEVERVINDFPAVRDSAVVSAPDDRWGERVVAFVAVRNPSDFSPEALQQHCRASLASYKVPKEIHAIAAIPLNANGKPDRRALSDPIWAGRSRRIN